MRLAPLLGLIAALLAWTAVAIRFAGDGEIDWGTAAAGAFVAALSIGTWKRSGRGR